MFRENNQKFYEVITTFLEKMSKPAFLGEKEKQILLKLDEFTVKEMMKATKRQLTEDRNVKVVQSARTPPHSRG